MLLDILFTSKVKIGCAWIVLSINSNFNGHLRVGIILYGIKVKPARMIIDVIEKFVHEPLFNNHHSTYRSSRCYCLQ